MATEMEIKRRWPRRRAALAICVMAVWLVPSWAQARASRFVLIVASNQSPDPALKPLSFADDDGAKFFELFSQVAEVRLHVVLDAEAQRRYVQAAAAARAPKLGEVEASLEDLFGRIRAANQRGEETHFYFLYSGHGGLGPNREGYLSLLDGKLSRTWLYHQLLARSPARFNHLLIDACHAYHVINKRGQQPQGAGDVGDQVERFLKSEDLVSYPNTGVLLAMSSESETHEWGLWESGIFSHELRSALQGAADVNGDGRVTYLEAAACIDSANSTVADPKARLNVYVRPPPLRQETSLIDLGALGAAGWLRFSAREAGRYHLIDSRGVRVFDLHFSSEQPLRVAMIGQGPFYLHVKDRLTELKVETGEVEVAGLTFGQADASAKGFVEESFRKHLYEVPFGLSFYRGMRLGQERASVNISVALPPPLSLQRKLAWVSLGLASAGAVAAGVTYNLARETYDDYRAEQDPVRVRALRDLAETRTNATYALLGVTGVLAITSLVLWVWDDAPGTSLPIVSPVPGGALVGAGWEF